MNNNPNEKQLKAITFYSNYGKDPCAHLRARGPMGLAGISIVEGKEGNKTFPERVSDGDLVLIQRDFPRDLPTYEKIIELAHKESKPVIFDIDDLLFCLPENHPDRLSGHYTPSLLPMYQALHEADCVTVTTPKLKNDLSKFNKNISVLPNFFDDSIWQLREPGTKNARSSPIIIGYMGSESHIPDLTFITPVLKELLVHYPSKINIHIWGVKPPQELAEFQQVRWIPAITYEYVGFAKYFQTQYADIFISPLTNNSFNRSKSPLKYFEYTALGAPGVYSQLETYEQVITHGYNGLLAATQEEWLEYLIYLINNKEARLQLAKNATETIRSNWLLSQNYYRWQELYEQCINSHAPYSREETDGIELVKAIANQYYQIEQVSPKINQVEMQEIAFELSEIKRSKAWKIALWIRNIRLKLVPPNSFREKIARFLLDRIRGYRLILLRRKRKSTLITLLDTGTASRDLSKIIRHMEPIDIIICVHNAFEDVRKCLESVKKYTTDPYTIIIVDDGSDEPTKDYLESFVSTDPFCTLIRNKEAKGYTIAANIGMRHSKSPYLILLNSDTIVGPEWVDRMYCAMTKNPKIGVVGPLSNTASWQSIPKLMENGDWAMNPLPQGTTPENMSILVSKYSDRIYPEVPLLNGFCMMIRKSLINEIGYFDEENFGQGYGEEDDFNLRAGDAGWKKVIADDVFIYHAQSKSYSNSRRYNLSRQSGERLNKKHGVNKIIDCVAFMNPNRVVEGVRNRSDVLIDREAFISKGNELFSGKKLLFVLPVVDTGGGANVVIDEARCMIQMGVDARIFNLSQNKAGFIQSYPNLDVPLHFGDIKDLINIATPFDAVIATAHISVEWIKPLQPLENSPILGYYVQGFEPLIYPEVSDQYHKALTTYNMIKGCKLFTKTKWTSDMVRNHTGVDSNVVGISVNIDLYRPRDIVPFGEKPVRIVAMIRPSTPYRNPDMTMAILQQVAKKYGDDVDIWLFGTNDIREGINEKYLDFKWKQFGKLTQQQVASMMSKADIFTDFSSHQAMGLTALEAMSAGCTVIVPQYGGAVEFIRDEQNGIVVDTSDFPTCLHGLEKLIENGQLRKQLQLASMKDVVQFYPEKVSYNILHTIFSN